MHKQGRAKVMQSLSRVDCSTTPGWFFHAAIKLLPSLLLCWSLSATAAIDAYPFPEDGGKLQGRYDKLIAELRCPQCLNTNLAGSDAMIAADLRREVHRMLLEGKTDEQIVNYLHARYGDFILYRPRLGWGTMPLWFGPVLLLLVAALVLAIMLLRTRRQGSSPDLDGGEQVRLHGLLGGQDETEELDQSMSQHQETGGAQVKQSAFEVGASQSQVGLRTAGSILDEAEVGSNGAGGGQSLVDDQVSPLTEAQESEGGKDA